MEPDAAGSPSHRERRPAGYPLLDALIERRSGRFGRGMRLNGGPLAHESASGAEPSEEAALRAPIHVGVRGRGLRRQRIIAVRIVSSGWGVISSVAPPATMRVPRATQAMDFVNNAVRIRPHKL